MQKIDDPEVIKVLKGMRFDGNVAIITGSDVRVNPLSPKLYKKVDAVLSALGGKWSRKDGGHRFPAKAEPIIKAAVNGGEYHDAKKDDAYFPTPETLAQRVVMLAEIKKGMTVCEPSAGRGAIVKPLVKAGAKVLAIEINESYRKDLEDAGAGNVVIEDFLSLDLPEQVDRVVMNPPFNRGLDIKHVTHAYECLKPGGVLVAIMGMGWTFSSVKAAVAFRKLVSDYGEHIEDHEAAFKQAGTNITVSLVRLRKPV